MPFSVLIVDDERMPREILKQYVPWKELQIETVYEADDGEAALALVRSKLPDIIISDIKMPRMNGIELAKNVRDIHPACKFVFLSGYPDKEYLKDAIKLKAASFVEKPIDLEEVSQVLAEIRGELTLSSSDASACCFFRGEQNTENSSPLNTAQVFAGPEPFLSELENGLKKNERHQVQMTLSRLYRELKSAEGTSPDAVRQIYCQVIFRFLSASESRNFTLLLKERDSFLYQVTTLPTLKQIHELTRELCTAYFTELDSMAMDPLTKVNQYIEKNYANPVLTVQSMAQNLGFSNTYLCAVYKKASGKTINQQITLIRLEHSKELLRSSGMKLQEVASAVGYTDSSYFTRIFTRETGVSPRQYRERHFDEA